MENVSDIFSQFAAYIAAVVAFVSGLLVRFREADKRMKIVYLIGGIAAIAFVLGVIQALFG